MPGNDLGLLISSHIPLIIIESHEERRIVRSLTEFAVSLGKPLFHWTITQGLKRVDIDLEAQKHNTEPDEVLKHIRASQLEGIYVMADFHPYLSNPINVRLLKDIALDFPTHNITMVLISHQLEIPGELQKYSARYEMSLPDQQELEQLVHKTADEWRSKHPGQKVRTDRKTLDALLRNLSGLTLRDAHRLIRNAIYDDGAITEEDLPRVMEAKYRLLNSDGILSFEYDTANFGDVGGLSNLKKWLKQRKAVFHGDEVAKGLDKPKGILLLGVQGGGKSLAAKAIAGIWNIPLLRLDFGSLYNKFHGETERNLRESLTTAETMSPCVLWMDEIEKGIAQGTEDGGTSKRVLGTLLTWMAEKKEPVFMVATANDIEKLPPELVRKGRFDEIFFVDLPNKETRAIIFDIHLKKRDIDPESINTDELATLSDGFSGAEIEQVVVAGLYSAHAQDTSLSTSILVDEIDQTKPLSVTMAEKIAYLRQWASERTVPAE